MSTTFKNLIFHSRHMSFGSAKMVTIEIFKTSVANSIVPFGNGSNRQLSISKNETMFADADMKNSRADCFIGIVSNT